jgi:stage II sporulation protein R
MTKSKITYCDIFAYICFFVLIVFIIFSAIRVSQDKKDIAHSVLRLHVLANSNEPQDVNLKFLVRDELLNISQELSMSDINNAKQSFIENIPNIKKKISNILVQNNMDYDFDIQVSDELYPTRRYKSLVFPQGKYLSVRVNLGKAQGDNWWCVLFPQLCIGGEAEEAMIAAGLTPSQIRLITGDSPDVVIRFRLLEWLTAIFSER